MRTAEVQATATASTVRLAAADVRKAAVDRLDTPGWLRHKLAHPSWAGWRHESQKEAEAAEAQLAALPAKPQGDES